MNVSRESPNPRRRLAPHPDDGAIFRDQGGESRLPAVLPMGDFYELFFEDAEVASRALGIVLTKRGKHEGEDIRMCGVPIERKDDYLSRLIALGHRSRSASRPRIRRKPKSAGRSRSSAARSCGWSRPAPLPRSGCSSQAARAFWSRCRRCARARGGRCTASPRSIFRPARSRSPRPRSGPRRGDSRGSSRARSSPRRRSATNPSFRADRARDARARDAACARQQADGAAAERRVCESMVSGSSTASAPSPGPRSRPPRSRWLTSSAPSSKRGRPSGLPRAGRAERASRSTPRLAPPRAHPDPERREEGSLLATLDLTVTPAGARLLAERLASP